MNTDDDNVLVAASLPAEMIKLLRGKAHEFMQNAEGKRREARNLEIRASELYDAFLSFDLLADRLEAQLAQAIDARSGETRQRLDLKDESAVATPCARTEVS